MDLIFLEILISESDFGPVKLPGLSRNGPLVCKMQLLWLIMGVSGSWYWAPGHAWLWTMRKYIFRSKVLKLFIMDISYSFAEARRREQWQWCFKIRSIRCRSDRETCQDSYCSSVIRKREFSSSGHWGVYSLDNNFSCSGPLQSERLSV